MTDRQPAESSEQATPEPRVAVVGGGVAGLTAGTYLARAGFDAVVVDHGESILGRNAHLENVPGFPAGVNARTFLDLLEAQTRRNGCPIEPGHVRNLTDTTEGFQLRVEGEGTEFDLLAEYAIAASWADTDYLEGLDVGLVARGSKTYVEVDDDGRTSLEGLYAAGRIAGKPHQAVVAAGHGAEVALTLIDDSPVPFYHDWVAPEGYFTGRGREVPPGVEEIDETERRRRERESMEVIREAFAERHPEEPTMHPTVVANRENEE